MARSTEKLFDLSHPRIVQLIETINDPNEKRLRVKYNHPYKEDVIETRIYTETMLHNYLIDLNDLISGTRFLGLNGICAFLSYEAYPGIHHIDRVTLSQQDFNNIIYSTYDMVNAVIDTRCKTFATEDNKSCVLSKSRIQLAHAVASYAEYLLSMIAHGSPSVNVIANIPPRHNMQ